MQRHIHDRDRLETFPFAERLRALADEKPGRFLLAELASDDPEGAIADYTAPGRFHTAYAFRFLSKPFGGDVIRKGVEELFARAPDAWPSWAFSNHDFERAATRWGAGRDAEFPKTLLMLLTSLPGTAFVYQGEELALPQAEVPFEALRDPDGIAFWPAYKGRDGARTPMPWSAEHPRAGFSETEGWLPHDERHRNLAVDRQEADTNSMLAFTRRWLAFRRTRPAFLTTAFAFEDDTPEGLLALTRGEGAQRLRLLFNLGDQPLTISAAGWRLAYGHRATVDMANISLPPGAAAALEPNI